MKIVMKAALACAVAAGLVATTACEEMAAITEGVLMACEQNPQGCDELFLTTKPAPKPLDPSRW